MTYIRPATLADALAARAHRPLQLVSGGTDCYTAPTAAHGTLGWLDISGVATLRGISSDGEWTRMGATTKWTDIASCADSLVPASLRQAAQVIGSRQIQAQGTIGGNICNASPVADGVPPLMSLDARVVLASVQGTRELKLSEFLYGRRTIQLRSDEILTCVKFRTLSVGEASAFYKFGNRKSSTIAVVSAAIFLRWSPSQVIDTARVVVGGASEVPVRATSLESAFIGRHLRSATAEMIGGAIPELSPMDDIRATAAFRTRLASVVVVRATQRLRKGLKHVVDLA